MPRFDPILGERMARQGLCAEVTSDAAHAATLAAGLQAQDAAASRLGVRARSSGITETDVLSAIRDRAIVRTWLMRNTIHLVAAGDVRWMSALLGPMIRRRFETVRWPALGLGPELLDRAAAVTPDVLAGRQLDRHEFVAALADHGVALPTDGQVPSHVLVYLSTIGLVCRAHDRGRTAGVAAGKGAARSAATFALLDEWVPPDQDTVLRGDDALAELARRYFRAFSPATAADFTAWSGLPSSQAITLIRDELTPVEVYGRPGFRLAQHAPAHGVRLLPAFDNYVLAHRFRDPVIDSTQAAQVYVGGIIRPTVIVDGRVAGRWRLVRKRTSASVELTPFARLTRTVAAAVEAEVADIGRFVEQPTTLTLVDA